MKQIDKRYVFSWNNIETGDLYELFVIASHDSTYSGTDVEMPTVAITSISVEWERDGLPFGLSSAVKLNVEFDLNSLGTNGQDFVDLITNPFESYNFIFASYSVNHTFDCGNLFFLRITDANDPDNRRTFYFNQKVGLEGLYEDNKLTIECYSVSRITAENVYLEWFNKSIYNDTIIKQRQSAWDIFYEDSGNKKLWFADSQHSSVYFWFIPVEQILSDFQSVVHNMTIKVTRGVTSSIYISDGSYMFNANHYKNDYTINNAKGTLLGFDDLYILGFITNSSTASGGDLLKSYITELDNYKTLWDYLKVLFKQQFVRGLCGGRSITTQGLLNGTSYDINNEVIDKAKIEKYSNVIVRAESSLVEFYENDIKSKSIIKPSSGNENAETIGVIINNIPSDRKNVLGLSGHSMSDVGRSRADYNINSGGNRAYSYGVPNMSNLYYYETANAVDYVFVRVNSLFDLDFNSTRNSSEIFNTEVPYGSVGQYFPNDPFVQQNESCYTTIVPKLAVELFGQNLQSKLSVKIRNSFDNFEALFVDDRPFSYDLSNLAPAKFPNLFDNISNRFYITKIKCELMGGSREMNYIEIEGINNQWELT